MKFPKSVKSMKAEIISGSGLTGMVARNNFWSSARAASTPKS